MNSDLEASAKAIAELAQYAAAGKEEWQAFNSAFFSLYPGSITSFNVFDRKSMSLLLLAADKGVPQDLERDYVQHYGRINPWNDFWPRASVGRPYATTRTQPSSLFAHTEFYNDWLLKTGAQECVGMKLVTSDDEVIVFSTMLPKAGLEKNETHALALFGRIAPSLIKGVETSRLSARQGANSIAAAALVDRSPDAAFVINHARKVVAANAQAEQALKSEDLILLHAGRFKFRDGETAAWLKSASSDLLFDRPVANNRRLCQVNGRYLDITLSRLPYTGGAPVPSRILQPFLMLIVVRELSAAAPSISAKLLADLFRLSDAESAICAHLRDGLTLNEIADLRNLSRETVRHHLKAIFRKSGTGRQAELVALLQRLR